MGITGDNFDLNQPYNLANCKFFLSSLMRYSDLSQVDCVVHKALELYAFYRDNWKSFNPRIPHPND